MSTQAATQLARSQTRRLAIPRPVLQRGLQSPPYIDHWVLQLQGVAPTRIDNPDRLISDLNTVVDDLGLTRVSEHSHYFVPGVSAVIILSESHLSVHTWPELEYMHVDLLTCVEKLKGADLERTLRRTFQPAELNMVRLDYTNRS